MWQEDRDDGDGSYAHHRRLGCCALYSMTWPFHVPLGSGRAWVEVLKYQLFIDFGQPVRKLRCVAFSSVDSFGLHNDWCANFTAFALICTECVNAAIWGCPDARGFRCGLPTCPSL